MDSAGNVWHSNFLPSERDGHSNGELVRFVTVDQKCEGISQAQLITRTHYVVTKVYEGTNQVAEMFQQESLNNYAPLSANEFGNKSSNMICRMNGQPYQIGILESKFTKVADFVPVDFERNVDMRQALAQYLHERGLENLIPTGNSGSSQ